MARSEVTLMDPILFAELMTSLDTPDPAPPALRQAGEAPRRSRVVAYTAIQPTQLAASTLSRAQAGGHTTVPGYLIARLAVDRALHGTGIGGELLIRALEVCVDASRIGGSRIVAVDPIDDAATAFHEHFGFTPTKGPDQRLVMKASTAAAVLGH